jgi:hypothetical protein
VLTDCRCATESLPGLRSRGGFVDERSPWRALLVQTLGRPEHIRLLVD